MAKGISRGMFVAGIVVAILVSSLLSTVIASRLLKGPKGDKGDTGPQGSQGGQGLLSLFSAHAEDEISTNSFFPSWADMSAMSVNATLSNKSDLLIMFSAMAFPGINTTIFVRAMVGEKSAYPSYVWLTPTVETVPSTGSPGLTLVGWGSYSFNFNMPAVTPGTYVVKIQWSIVQEFTESVYIRPRSLNVIVSPTQ
jgi:hypothetical protein